MISTHILVGGVLPGALSDSLTVGAGEILVLFKRAGNKERRWWAFVVAQEVDLFVRTFVLQHKHNTKQEEKQR